MIEWRQDETVTSPASSFARDNGQHGRAPLAQIPRPGFAPAQADHRTVLGTPRRRRARIMEEVSALITALSATLSEKEARQVAVDGLQALLPGCEVELRLSPADSDARSGSSAAGRPVQYDLANTSPDSSGPLWRADRRTRTVQAHGQAQMVERVASPPRLVIPIILGGKVVGELMLHRAAGRSGFDSDTAALAHTIAGALAHALAYLRLRNEVGAGTTPQRAFPPAPTTAPLPSESTPTQAEPGAEAWLTSALDAVADGILILDAQERVVVANATFRHWFDLDDDPVGSSGAELLQRTSQCLKPHMHADGHAGAHDVLLEQCAPCRRILERRTLPLSAVNGQAPGTLTIYRDITREYDEREHREEFLTSLAHELRTPLTCIAGHAQLVAHRLRRQAESDTRGDAASSTREQWHQRAARPLQAIQRQIKRMNRLLGDMLDTSRLDEGILRLDIEECDAVTLARTVIADLSATTRLHQIILDAPASVPLWCDADRVEQIMYNLVNNAIKYSPQGGHVVVRLRTDDGDTPSLALTVSDQGAGIPADERERIFERYVRANTTEALRTAGIGLGLHISRALAQQHGGTLRMLDTGTSGTTFELRLPLSGTTR